MKHNRVIVFSSMIISLMKIFGDAPISKEDNCEGQELLTWKYNMNSNIFFSWQYFCCTW